MNRRLRWFDEGAPKLRVVLDRLGLGSRLPDGEDYYACPCCLTCYPRGAVAAGQLTEEHVPPERVGGRGMLLTCATCNSRSGTHFDGHAATRSDADDFIRGRITGRKLPVTSYLDGIPLRGTIEQTEDGVRILGVPKQNDSMKVAAYGEALNANIEAGNQRPNFRSLCTQNLTRRALGSRGFGQDILRCSLRWATDTPLMTCWLRSDNNSYIPAMRSFQLTPFETPALRQRRGEFWW